MTGGHSGAFWSLRRPETADQLVESLRDERYQVDLATSGNEALSRGATGGYASSRSTACCLISTALPSCVGS